MTDSDNSKDSTSGQQGAGSVLTKVRNKYPAEYFFNRELNWLEFNNRVLQEAENPSNPMLERLKFVAISASNLDEFFMKRIGGLKRQIIAGVKSLSKDGMSVPEQLDAIGESVREMIKTQHRALSDWILPALAEHDIQIVDYGDLGPDARNEVDDYYDKKVFPMLTPLGVGPGHPFPFLSNLSVSLAVRLNLPGQDEPQFARIKIPSNRPRFVKIGGTNHFLPLERLVQARIGSLFPGAEILESEPFYIIRNAEIERYEEEAEDLVELIHEELRHRKFARMVRLSVNESISDGMRMYLQQQLGLEPYDVYTVPGLLRLSDLFEISSADVPELRDRPWIPTPHPRLRVADEALESDGIFRQLYEGDLLVHHPYQSFDSSVLRLLETAASDPKVVTIKQTLYRTAKDSPIVRALIKAAENGKQVAVLVEIKARFDEANNLRWVQELENAGVHVAYGLVGLKTHTKVMMVARDEEDGVRLYTHIGTGNYHTGTAKLYTDLGYFVSDNRFADDITQLFNLLTGYNAGPSFKHLIVAPVNMRERFTKLIRSEAANAREGKAARIIAKMNQLEDDDIIVELYEASKAGVEIDLIVRGFCSLRPGVEGLSENIRVRSIIGRFLEHSRIFYFHAGGDERYFIGSADWMGRNLDRRVELATPVESPSAREELSAILESCLGDNTNSWELHSDGKYARLTASEGTTRTHQIEMMRRVEQIHAEMDSSPRDSIRFRAVSRRNEPKGSRD